MDDPSTKTALMQNQQYVPPNKQAQTPLQGTVGAPVAQGVVIMGVPAQPQGGSQCQQCGAPYPLPPGATSFRCKQCHHFNSTGAEECPCCVVA